MPSVVPPRHSARNPQANPVLCASAAARLIWAAGALVLLWTTVLWALD
jgi:cell division septal protein FtsQ